MDKENFQGFQGFQWWFGKVVDLADPLKLGRVRVAVFGIYDGLAVNELPWALPIQPFTSAAQKGIGFSPTGIETGSIVFGFFVDTDQQQPVILGTYAGTGDIHDLALGTDTLTRDLKGPEKASSYKALYPFNKVHATSSGHIFEIDDTVGSERIHTRHKSGSYLEYRPLGDILFKSVDELIIVSEKDMNFFSVENNIQNAKKHLITDSVEYNVVAPAVKINGTSSVNIDSKTIELNGTTVTIDSSGTVTIKAPKINLEGSVAVSGGTFTFEGQAVKAGSISG